MADIRAFCGFRPRADLADQIAALPYDVYNSKEAREEVKAHPRSFLRIDRAETQFPEGTDLYSPEVYQKAKELLQGMIADGSYIQDQTPCYYLYDLTMMGRAQTGIVACSSIDDYQNNIIKKHENTREEKEQDRIRHVDVCNAQTGPIFLAYRSSKEINRIVDRVKKEAPVYDFVSEDEIGHRVWVIDCQEDVERIRDTFAKIQEVYIADGHHRAASAVKVGLKRRAEHPDYDGSEEFNYFLSVLFPHDQLMIMPYNRVVADLNGMSRDEFLQKLAEKFTITESKTPVQPEKKATFGLFLNEQWYTLEAHKELLSDDPVEGLDVSILQREVLTPLLKIQDPRTDKRIDFVGGIRGLQELERRANEDMQLAFSMYPTSIQELFRVADAKKLMPPKSTWFEPKLRSGIFVHQL